MLSITVTDFNGRTTSDQLYKVSQDQGHTFDYLISGKVQNVKFFFILNPNASVFKLYQMTSCEWEQDNTPNFLSDTAQCLINSIYNCLLFLLL